jgi:hypothetical protein
MRKLWISTSPVEAVPAPAPFRSLHAADPVVCARILDILRDYTPEAQQLMLETVRVNLREYPVVKHPAGQPLGIVILGDGKHDSEGSLA